MNVDSIRKFHLTKPGLLTYVVIEALASYLFGSLAINSGSLWQYALALILFIGAVQNLIRLIRKLFNAER